MAKNSKQKIFLADHDKENREGKRVLFSFDDVDYIVSDYHFDEKIKEKFPNTKFIETN